MRCAGEKVSHVPGKRLFSLMPNANHFELGGPLVGSTIRVYTMYRGKGIWRGYPFRLVGYYSRLYYFSDVPGKTEGRTPPV